MELWEEAIQIVSMRRGIQPLVAFHPSKLVTAQYARVSLVKHVKYPSVYLLKLDTFDSFASIIYNMI